MCPHPAKRRGARVGGAGISRVDGVIRRRTSGDFVWMEQSRGRTSPEGTGRRTPALRPSFILNTHCLLHVRGL